LLIVDGPRDGENDFVEFPSIEAAVAYAREVRQEPRYQLDGIEDSATGKLIVTYGHLQDLCREQPPEPERRYG
jgi:hypothetical protein